MKRIWASILSVALLVTLTGCVINVHPDGPGKPGGQGKPGGGGPIKPHLAVVPNIIGKTPAQAKPILAAAKLKLGKQTKGPAVMPPQAGRIEAQNPGPGVHVAHGTTVNVVVYQTKIALFVPVVVPNVVGKNEAAAKSILQNAGLKVGKVIPFFQAKPPSINTVKSQTPAAGTKVKKGTKVNLSVYRVMKPLKP